MSHLYDLAAEYRAVSDKLHDAELDEQTIADALEGMAGDLQTKALNVGFVIRNLEGMAAQIKQAEEGMARRRKSIERRTDSLKGYLLTNLQLAGISKVESPYFVLYVRNNQESVVIDAEGQIPDEFMREIPATYQPDRRAIKQAIQAGETVPGCHLTRSQSIIIK